MPDANPTPDAARIAAGLSEAQRRALTLTPIANGYAFGKRRTMWSLCRKGLVQTPDNGIIPWALPTALGRSVSAHLAAQEPRG